MQAPRCFRHYRPIFCKFKGYAQLNGRIHVKHVCPECRFMFLTRVH